MTRDRQPGRERRRGGRALRPRRPASGVVLLALLLALALAGLAALAAADVWTVTRQREREQQLLFVGQQYRLAIRGYFFGAPAGGGRALPPTLAAQLDDERFPIPVHHLRRLYPDPITGSTDWGLVMAGDRIIGVYSKSDAQPLKQAGFAPSEQTFADKASYRDWIFAFVPGRRAGLPDIVPTAPAQPGAAPHSPSTGNPS